MPYEARPADPELARSLLLEMWAKNLGTASGDLGARLRWFYREGPHGNGCAYVVHDGDEPIGCAGIGTRTLVRYGEPLRAALFADLAVDRRYRSGLPALVLLRSIQRRVADEFDVGYGFPNRKAVAVYRRAGYQLLGEMPRYVRVLRSAEYLRRKLRWLAIPAAAVVDRSLAAMAAMRAHAARDFTLAWPADFDTRFDELWREASRELTIACERTAELLHWRFSRQPDVRYQIVTLERASVLRGYAVLRDDHGMLEISDLLAASDAECDALLALLVPAVAERGAAAVGLRFLGTRRIVELLQRHGFSRRPSARAVMIAARRPELLDAESWYLTDLDEDS